MPRLPPSRPDLIAEATTHWVSHWGNGRHAKGMAAVTSIMRAQQILMARLNALLKPFSLTFPRYEALMLLYLSRRGSLPLARMGERLQVHPTSVTNLIDGLEQRAFVTRVHHPSDRRTTLAAITDAGRVAAEEATNALNAAEFAISPLGVRDMETLVAILRRLRADEDGFDDAQRRIRS